MEYTYKVIHFKLSKEKVYLDPNDEFIRQFELKLNSLANEGWEYHNQIEVPIFIDNRNTPTAFIIFRKPKTANPPH